MSAPGQREQVLGVGVVTSLHLHTILASPRVILPLREQVRPKTFDLIPAVDGECEQLPEEILSLSQIDNTILPLLPTLFDIPREEAHNISDRTSCG